MLGSTGDVYFVTNSTMNDKDLLRRLASLQSVAPDASWVAQNRAVLSSQISNGVEYGEIKLGFFASLSLFSKRLAQPTSIAAMIVIVLATGFVGVKASQKSRPGDPLYIAKTISEKARLVAELNEMNKAKLNLEFASQRASELESIAETSQADDPRLKELSDSFKNELAAARQRLSTSTKDAPAAKTSITATVEPVTKEETPVAEDEGVTIAETPDVKEEISSVPEAIDEVQQLFDQKNYDGAIDKLKGIQIR